MLSILVENLKMYQSNIYRIHHQTLLTFRKFFLYQDKYACLPSLVWQGKKGRKKKVGEAVKQRYSHIFTVVFFLVAGKVI